MAERQALIDQINCGRVDYWHSISICNSILDDISYELNDAYKESPFCVLGKYFSDARDYVAHSEKNVQDIFLDYSELVLTVFRVHLKNYGSYKDAIMHATKVVGNTVNKMGWIIEFDKEKDTYITRRKDLKAEIVAANQPETTKDKIYDYLSIRNGDTSSKRDVLKSLIDDVETFCKKRSSIKEIDKTKQFYQCVRHTKDEPKKEFPFYYTNEEKWLDCIFQMVIDVLSFEDLERRVQTIIEEENKK